jgi:tRNA(Ile2) C34 agmatinyltransferase TiaS
MPCPAGCGVAMYVNGRYWQCPQCGALVPYNGYVPEPSYGDTRAASPLRC